VRRAAARPAARPAASSGRTPWWPMPRRALRRRGRGPQGVADDVPGAAHATPAGGRASPQRSARRGPASAGR